MPPTETERKLGNIALATNNHPRGQTPKLESVGDDPDERFFMLATFCFDLSRKLKYISMALSEHYQHADEAFKRKIQDDECFINPKSEPPDSWEAMAIRAESVMRRLHRELLANQPYPYPPHPPEGGCPETQAE